MEGSSDDAIEPASKAPTLTSPNKHFVSRYALLISEWTRIGPRLDISLSLAAVVVF